jgi:hypothetical protein
MKIRRILGLLFAGVLGIGVTLTAGTAANAVTPSPDIYYRVIPRDFTSQCLDVPDGRTGTVAMQTYHCHDFPSNGAQLWNIYPVGTDFAGRTMYEVFNKSGHGCVQPLSSAINTRLYQGICNGDPQQEWYLVSIFTTDSFQLVNEWTGQCMSLFGTVHDHGAVVQNTCDFDFYNALQLWQIA